ncbi:MAG TPA: tartrate dehydrogenase [Mycobacteriales bacterium]|nr:tartrate dehydrogenase [Mycobacteriales bacterium]
MSSYSVAVIAGDGIGPEVVAPAIELVDRVAGAYGSGVEWTHFPWGSDHYRAHGRMMPADALDQLRPYDALFFGAVGAPDIPDTVTLWGLLIPIRRGFEQYVNLRPVRHIEGVPSPLAAPQGIDLVIVRENSEGEYSDVGGRKQIGTPDEYAAQETRFTRRGTERIARYAAELALRRSGKLTSATKSNGILHTMPYWDEVVAETVARYEGVELRPILIDALVAALVQRPQQFDVIVGSNLFGDILSDLTAACVGSLGLAPSANLNPEREFPSMFEPVHGSAPDIAGQGVANPMAQFYSAAMMLDHLGEPAAAAAISAAVDAVLRDGIRSRDLGGTAGTTEVTEAVLTRLTLPGRRG